MKVAITVSEQGELLIGYYWHFEDDQGKTLSERRGPYQTWGKCLDELAKEWPIPSQWASGGR